MAEQKSGGVALVTGGAKRVGRAVVERLATAGFDIAFTFLGSEPEATELATRVRSLNRRCLTLRADLTEPVSATDSISQAVENEFGRLDVLVNNASLYLPGRLDQFDLEESRRMWAIHVEAPLLLCRAFGSRLREARGHVVNMVDVMAERPIPQYLAYATTKAALWNLTLGLARELAPDVTVNGIAPGAVEWPEGYPQADREAYLKRVPLGRVGTPRDVADTIHFLCTGGRYITGQVIRLDGGRSIT